MTLREGLLRVRAGEAAHPEAVAALRRLAGEFGTPLYVYDAETIREKARALREAFAPRFRRLALRYALKANTNVEIVRRVLAEGLAPEVVSEGEVRAALRAGASGRDVLFTSSSKRPSEIDFALRHEKSGLAGAGGSGLVTSSAAPASLPALSASTSASSSTMPPRETTMR